MRTILPVKHRLVPDQAQCVFQGEIYDVYQWQQELYDGSTTVFEMLKRPDTIQVIAIKDDKLVVLLEEQPTMGQPYYGLPGGRHDVGNETEVEAAQREMAEETGMTFASWRLLNIEQPHSKIDHFVYYYLAYDFIGQNPPHLDAGEKIIVQLMTLEAAREISDSSLPSHLPDELLDNLDSIEELKLLPEYEGVKA
jgi:ADP-ribose pyrophosphatase